MVRRSIAALVVLVLTVGGLLGAGLVAGANPTTVPPSKLAAVGPTDPVTGFPSWYRDANGLSTSPCVDGTDPLCGLAAGVMPNPAQPTVFPTNFPTESFYSAAGAKITLPGGGTAELVTGLEAAFATAGRVTPGQQVTFGRVRIRIDTPAGGHYTITHPYGVDEFDVPAAGTKTINFTEDVGIGASGFAGALNSRINPFLTWDTGLVTGPSGAQYLGDPAVLHKVTGSALGTDFFRVEGPGITGGSAQTDLFTVSGRVATRMGLDAGTPSYTRTTPDGGFVDVFAGSTTGQILQATGTGIAPTTLRSDGAGRYFARVAFTGNPPAQLTVTNASDRPATTVTLPLVDRVVVSQAAYDADKRELTVQAASSDPVTAPGMQVEGYGPLDASGHGVFTSVEAPPATVVVASGKGGKGTAPVFVSGAALAANQVAAVAGPDRSVQQGQTVTLDGSASLNASSLAWSQTSGPAVVLTGAAGPVVTFTAPTQGGALVFVLTAQGAGGPVTDEVTITVATVAAPVANAGAARSVLVGDVATLDGSASTGAATYTWTQTAGTPVTLTGATTAKPTFTVPRSTTPLAFTLAVSGPGGSAAATTTVTAATDTLRTTVVTYRTGNKVWKITGTSTVTAGNTVTVWLGPTLGGVLVGTAVVDTTGAWSARVPKTNIVPGTPPTVSIESTRGSVLLAVPVTVN
jgi:hypothetical protein